MKKEADHFYLKKMGDRGKFKIWIVDGNYIRTNMDEEFTNYGQHCRFKFIPKNELWIDKEYGGDDESEFYIDIMLNINRFISQGLNHKEAVRRVNIIERKERRKSEFFKRSIGKTNKKEEEIKAVKKELIKKYSSKMKVWIVNGELVRDLFFLDFTEGGHDKVYHFIPKNEIWIDDDVSSNERKFVLLHEIHERNLMSRGKDYKSAHRSSSKIEFFARHNPKEFKKIIFKEIKIMKSFNKLLVKNKHLS
ncbi:MAG: hypothetical protein ABIA78_03065 [archaeon]